VIRAVLAAVAGGLLISGCSANWHTVFRLKPLKSGENAVVAVDAKQRAILTANDHFCSEPSPDVFSVIAQALTAGGSFSKSADPASVEAALNVAFSSAEQGSTIPRTQTINMLRELMFRTCERYLNGGITSDELPIQAVRDQRLMVSILAIEQLTGAVVAKPVAISATSTASLDSREALIRLDDARKELEAAISATAKANQDYETHDGDGNVCKAITAKLKEGKDLDEAEVPKKDACVQATAALADAKEREARARTHHADLQRLSTGIGSASAQTSGSTAGGIDQGREIQGVVDAVKFIVEKNFTDGTEVMLFCLRNLVPANKQDAPINQLRGDQITSLQDKCFDFLSILIESRSEILEKDRAIALEQKTAVADDRFASTWPALQRRLADATQREALIAAIKKQLRPSQQAKADCLQPPVAETTVRRCILGLPPDVQRRIAAGEL
jgi:hypothetical protein